MIPAIEIEMNQTTPWATVARARDPERLATKQPAIIAFFGDLRVLRRGFTGVGRFTNFDCDESAAGAPEDRVGLYDRIKMPGVPSGTGAVLSCRGGRPSMPRILHLQR